MEKVAALILLGFDPKSEIEQESIEIALEEAIFKEASFFMRRNFIPKLAEARMLKLAKLSKAGALFEIPFTERGETAAPVTNNRKIDACQILIDLILFYQNCEMNLKLALANEENPDQLIELYKKWILLFSAYAKRFISLFENFDRESSPSEIPSVSITQTIDQNELITDLKKEIYTGSVYKEYLRIQKMTVKSS